MPRTEHDDARRRLLARALATPFIMPTVRLGGVSLTHMAASSMLSPAMAADCNTGPRTLVCVFLAGGADSFNFYVPTDARYDTYRATRNDLAIEQSDLLDAGTNAQGSFAFHRLLPALHQSYQQGNLAVISNVGPLLRPTTQTDYQNQSAIPESLFAHDAQQKLWQTAAGRVSGTDGFGWGGAMAERIAACNANARLGGAFSMAGANAWQTGANSSFTSLNPYVDVDKLYGLDPTIATWVPANSREAVAERLARLLSRTDQGLMADEATTAINRSLAATDALDSALQQFELSEWQPNPANKLENQLHLVSRLIAARGTLSMERQVFFVRMGGWDTHSNQNERLPILLNNLNDAITPFQAMLSSLGVQDSVTTFTASDFGRTLTSNGNGTDHGWGGHNFVFGGAVQGGTLYGELPSYAQAGNPDDAGDGGNFAGRIIPQLSVNQYGATLARWMGVPDSELGSVFPDLDNFTVRNLGFLG